MRTYIFLWGVFFSSFLLGREGIELVRFGDFQIEMQEGWSVYQRALSDGIQILGLQSRDKEYIQLYSHEKEEIDLKKIVLNDSKILEDQRNVLISQVTWTTIGTSIEKKERSQIFVYSFSARFREKNYYGFSSSSTLEQAKKNVYFVLNNLIIPLSKRSLTDPGYGGKKYYLGWGAAHFSDPSLMHNEVKYDVLHTHDLFISEFGGGYLGFKMIGAGNVTGAKIRNEWSRLKASMTKEDMYVQYSSGHGSRTGLQVGVSYNEIRENLLSLPAKEVIVFIMACYSGGLVDSFLQKRGEWQSWAEQNRSLFVFSSSQAHRESHTGPGKDPDEAAGVSGSAGSAFGHSLWKALIGYADGYVDGVKDGFLSLAEIQAYTTDKTQEYGHTPQVTGIYNKNLILNRTPAKKFLESLEYGSENLSEEEIQQRIFELDEALRVQKSESSK